MKTRERLLFMAIGGLLVLAGMIVGQFVFSTAQAQDGAQDAVFRTVSCERLLVGDSLNRQAVKISSSEGLGFVATFNKAGKAITSLSVDDSFNGLILTNSNTGKNLVKIGSTDSGGMIGVDNTHGVQVVFIQANKDKDGTIALLDRYGDLGWIRTGKQ